MMQMIRNNWFPLALLLIASATNSPGLYAATINAASCTSSAVQSAINSAATGDTVAVPAGSCMWSSKVTVSGKALTIVGAGIGQTNITDSTGGGGAFNITASTTSFVSVSGFTFTGNDQNGLVQIYGTMFAVNTFRIHRNRFVISSCRSSCRGVVPYYVYGLIDHNIFDVSAGQGGVQAVSIWGSPDSTDGGFTPWRQPLTLGSVNAVYMEDNTFNWHAAADSVIDSYGGARWVFRHNTVISTTTADLGGGHGTDSGDRRSIVSWEIYNNSFTNNSGSTMRAGTIRGGTGVFFNNTFTGNYGSLTLMLYRACPPADQSRWQTCNGTNWQLGSTNLSAQGSRTASTNGGVKFCSGNRELLCTADSTCSAAGAGTCSTYFDGSGTGGYPCRDQPGVGPGQVSAPIYGWSNGGVGIGAYNGGYSCGGGLVSVYLVSGRDYINNGTTPKPGYTAYAYPHPLQSAGTTPPPTPPGGPTVVVQ